MYYKLLSVLGFVALWNSALFGQLTVTLPSDVLICAGETAQLTSSVSGGDGNYIYTWSPEAGLSCTDCPAPFVTPTVPGSTVTYLLEVEDGLGATGSASVTVQVDETLLIDVGSTVVTDVTCPNNNDGAIDLVLFGGFGATFWWTGPNGYTSTSQSLTNLTEGTYTVVATNSNGCEEEEFFTVNSSGAGVEVTGDVIGSICDGDDFVTLDITATGGSPGYTYSWSDGQTVEDISVSVAGIYTVTVTDVNGCWESLSLLVEDGPNININSINPTCADSDNGIVQVTGTSGATYLWSNGSTSSLIQDLAPGTYCVTVTTDEGCVVEDCVDLIAPPLLQVFPVVTNVTCANGNDGSIEVTVTGGVAPYAYSWNTGNTLPSIDNLSPGTYEVTVTDANGCFVVTSITIDESNPLELTIEGAPTVPCTDMFTLTAVVNGGVAPYTYEWSDNFGTVLGNEVTLENPNSELINVLVVDNNGCAIQQTTFGNYLPAININTTGILSCSSGTAVLDGSGSQSGPEYSYEWLGPDGSVVGTIPIIEVDQAGEYILTVSNPAISGCSISTSVSVVDLTLDFEGEITVNNIACGQYTLNGNAPPNYFGVVNYLWTYPDGSTSTEVLINATQSGQYTLQTDIPGLLCTFYATVFIDLEADACATVNGFVRHDTMELCILDPNDPGLAGWQVFATFDGETQSTFTDATGYYEFNVPATAGMITAMAPSPNWTDCVSIASVNPTEGQTVDANFWFQGEEECPELDVELSAAFLRRCFSSYYYLRVRNLGSEFVENAEVTLTLDDFLSYQGASISPVGIVDQTIVWNLGELVPGEIVTILVEVYVSCDATLGQTHCSEATVTPITDCLNIDDWSGTNLEVVGNCENEDVVFTVRNTGETDLSEVVNYIVIEDGVAMMQEQVLDDLGPDQMEAFTFPANGSTYTFQMGQVVNHPFSDLLSASVEGCGTNDQGSFSTGFVTQFPQTTASINSDILCLQNIGAYDPNDKTALPEGYGAQHYIVPETNIDYRIRFQNTGTDTAFTVVIRDTLSEFLDLSTLSLGNSSHEYTARVDQARTLIFTYNNILLPDSTTNLEASQGFVDFSISPLQSAPLETVIENSAGIYFDFNEPVITNTVFHTLGRDFLEVVNSTISPGFNLSWEVYPNPSQGNIVIELAGEIPTDARLLIFNSLGEPLLQLPCNGERTKASVAHLPAGWYHLQLRDAAGEVLGNAKLVKQ